MSFHSFHITHIPIREVSNLVGIFERYALETRPYDQGARLTTWECSTEGKSPLYYKLQSNKDKMFFLVSIYQYRKSLHAVHGQSLDSIKNPSICQCTIVAFVNVQL